MELNTTKNISKKKHDTITLSEVKDVTLSRVTESVGICKNFHSFLNSSYVDVFLARLLLYCNLYLQKKRLQDDNFEMIIEKSAIEKAEYEQMCKKVSDAKRLLGYSYSTILLGINNCKNHHMRCGNVPISDTYSDRLLFEALVRFSAVFVWIGLGRKNIDEIKQEISRLIGHKHNEETTITEDDSITRLNKEKAMIIDLDERSDVTMSILPNPKIKSNQPFVTHANKEDGETLICGKKIDDLESYFREINNFNPYSVKVGIIGEKAELFNPINLSPIEDDTSTKKVATVEMKSNLSKYNEMKMIYKTRLEMIMKLKFRPESSYN